MTILTLKYYLFFSHKKRLFVHHVTSASVLHTALEPVMSFNISYHGDPPRPPHQVELQSQQHAETLKGNSRFPK